MSRKSNAVSTTSPTEAGLKRQDSAANVNSARGALESVITPISPHPPQDLSLSPSPRTTPKLVPREPTIPLAGGKGTPREPTIPLAGGKGTPLEPTIPLAGGKGSDYEMLDITQAIEELDPRRRLESVVRKQRQQQLDLSAILNQSAVSWEEDAVMDSHIWYQVDTREACILNEETVCLDTKVPKRLKVKCSACNLVVHVNCFRHMSGFVYMHCKETFREIKQKVKNITVQHHFLLRHKASGKCRLCDKGYKKSAMLYTAGRELVAYGCSWCGDSYHITCFKEALRFTPCLLGPHRRSIVPPSWIVRTPAVDNAQARSSEPSTPAPERTASFELPQTTPSKPSTLPLASRTKTEGFLLKRKRSSKKSRRKKSIRDEERASKYFIVRPLVQDDIQPLLVFVNPKSGGNQGVKMMQTFQSLLNPRQVFDLTKGGPLFGLKMFIHVPNLRILVCGGDGTAGWVLSVLDEIMDRTATPQGDNTRVRPPVAVLPLGTGNDLARVLGWGGGYSDEPLERILFHIETGTVVNLDRWMLTVFPVPNEGASRTPVEPGAVSDIPLHVINNYFSIGADASVALEFHLGREANPEKFNSRLKNKFFYTRLGGKNIMQRKFANLTDSIELEGDGVDLTEQIRDLKLEAILLLNIPSYASGTNPWGSPSGRDTHGPQKFDDGKIEIIGLSALTQPVLQAGLAHGERIAQCVHIKLRTKKCIPVQIDGEAWKLCPSVIEIIHKNKVPMVMKSHQVTHTFQTPLKGIPSDYTIKLSVSAVTMEAYRRLECNLRAVSREVIELGYVETTPNDTLHSLRPKIEQLFAKQSASSSACKPAERVWRFLDVVVSDGREEDRLYQVMTDSETLVGDMPLDGIFVLEMSDSGSEEDASLTKQDSYTQLVTSMQEHSAPRPFPVDNQTGKLNRTHSYKAATCCSPEPLMAGSLEDAFSPPHSPRDYSPDSVCELSMFTQQDDASRPSCTVPKVDKDGLQKALFDAVKRGPPELVIELHTQGAKLAVVDEKGWTPLHYAARHGQDDIVKYIAHKVPRDVLDIQEPEKNQTPLHKAAWYEYYNVCKTLVDCGASVLTKDYKGDIPSNKPNINTELIEYLQEQEKRQLNVTDKNEIAV
ncbi:hypothetical protein EMCRGX_G025720 [Ephydatia muelleri]